MRLRPTCLLWMMLAALAGCGRNAGQSAQPKQSAVPGQPAVAAQPAAPRLIHSPPIRQLVPEQLRALSMECEKYAPEKSARGPYEAAYCEEAIAAWSDSPLQMIPIPMDKQGAARTAPASPQ
jgi:hypothetical protein